MRGRDRSGALLRRSQGAPESRCKDVRPGDLETSRGLDDVPGPDPREAFSRTSCPWKAASVGLWRVGGRPAGRPVDRGLDRRGWLRGFVGERGGRALRCAAAPARRARMADASIAWPEDGRDVARTLRTTQRIGTSCRRQIERGQPVALGRALAGSSAPGLRGPRGRSARGSGRRDRAAKLKPGFFFFQEN